ncbi:MAG: alpha/beta fold hydrolase [Candidatus Eremiobacteraeota bacterium]|nr:alpha/beta fold hydrolase [Candidatus Eremiobacteraeota bacterium]
MQVLVHDDVRIDARIDGSGDDAIVLIHGFPLAKEIWSAQIPVLARTHRVVAVDLRGMGGSSVVDGPYLMETLAGDVAAVMDHFSIDRATIVGHSLGGYVALAFARMYVERVARLALVCSRIVADTPDVANARNELATRLETSGSIDEILDKNVPALFAKKTLENRPEIVEKARKIAENHDPRGLAAMLRGMALRDSAEDIAPELLMPVLAVGGGADPIVPRQETERMGRLFPDARLQWMEGSGHAPMMEEADRLSAVLEAFTAG